MKKFTSILISCSLALAGAALAQQPGEQPSPTEGKGKHGAGKALTAEPKSGANVANPEGTETKRGGAKAERRAAKMQATETTPKPETTTGAESKVSGQSEMNTDVKQGKRGRNARGTNAVTSPSATPATTGEASVAPVEKQNVQGRGKGKKGKGADVNAQTSPSAAPTVAATASVAPTVAATGGALKKADPQKVQQVKQQVQQIKQQHTNFRAKARPDKVPSVTFNASFRLQGSDRWQGPQYEVYRSYRPERHDRGWYHSRYNRVELIGGGYYYWNNGYWYPAWGYDTSAEYYAYDAPIYVGHRAEPPDRVIADVQAELQEMGYYTGEVDGLLGPLTREALTSYQADQGLMTTAVIDQPTLDSLGMG